jgi:hypothetical protein
MRLIAVVTGIVFSLVCHTALAGQKSITCYLDGARVEQEATATKGYLEYALPESDDPGLVAGETGRRRERTQGGSGYRRAGPAACPRDR